MTFYQYESESQPPVIYLIDGKVKFNPIANTLSDVNELKKITIYAPATRCFLHLIEHQGKICSQRDLMYVGWEKYGMTVSPNTFYQNISNLRKALAELIDNNEIITTIKRSGLVINSTITIEKTEQQILSVENDSSPQSLREEAIISRSLTSLLSKGGRILTNKMTLTLMTMTTLIIIFVAIFYARHNYVNEAEYVAKYKHVADAADGCKIYINRDAGNDLDDNTLINPKTLDCRGYSKVYVTQWYKQKRFSVFFCNTENDMHCISEYYGVEHQ
ncbi:transcriptional regulator [Enterobacter hormaechei]